MVTQVGTKIEAIKAVEASGGQVAGLIVLVDRQQGGKEAVEKAGYPVYACFTIHDLFDFYLNEGFVDIKKHSECLEYLSFS